MAFDPEGVGHEPVDLEQLTELAIGLEQTAQALGPEYEDVGRAMLQQLQQQARAQLGNIVCGVDASYCVGFGAPDEERGELLTEEGSIFMGNYIRLSHVIAPDAPFIMPGIPAPEKTSLALIFRTIDPDEIKTSLDLEPYQSLATIYRFTAVPLVECLFQIERLPIPRIPLS